MDGKMSELGHRAPNLTELERIQEELLPRCSPAATAALEPYLNAVRHVLEEAAVFDTKGTQITWVNYMRAANDEEYAGAAALEDVAVQLLVAEVVVSCECFRVVYGMFLYRCLEALLALEL